MLDIIQRRRPKEMAKDRISAAIQNLDAEMKRAELERLAIQCDCVHHKDDDPHQLTLIPIKDKPGSLDYKCFKCKDIISILSSSPEERENAINMLVQMCNVIKMKCNLANDEDRELAKKVAKMEYKLRTFLPKAYDAATKQKKKKRSGNRSGEGQSMWQKPGVTR